VEWDDRKERKKHEEEQQIKRERGCERITSWRLSDGQAEEGVDSGVPEAYSVSMDCQCTNQSAQK
jgi:hypothetical protein